MPNFGARALRLREINKLNPDYDRGLIRKTKN